MHCLQLVLEVLAHYLPPGTLTLILGVLAAVSALPKVAKTFEESSWKHAVAIFVFCSIAALEIAVIRCDRRIQDQKHEHELEIGGQRFDKTVALLQGIQDGQNLQINAGNTINKILQQTEHTQKLSEERQLKIRTLDLARVIGEFATRVRTDEMAVPKPTSHGLGGTRDPAWTQWEAQLENIEHNAIAQYHYEFGESVKDVVAQLQKRKVIDSKECDTSLDMAYRTSAQGQFLYVLGCAQDLQRAADKLP